MNQPLKVDIWSDVLCPWCYIGKRRFDAALADFDGEVEVEYHSFELSPDTPIDYEGTPAEFLSERRGLSVDQVDQMLEQVTRIAAAAGLDYDFEHMHQTSTGKAHELLHFAKQHGRQVQLKEALLRACFIDGGHVGRLDELADIAEGIGLDRGEALRALESGEYAAAVERDTAQARRYGINGVPCYVFEGKYGVSGAQEVATFTKVLRQMAAEKEAA